MYPVLGDPTLYDAARAHLMRNRNAGMGRSEGAWLLAEIDLPAQLARAVPRLQYRFGAVHPRRVLVDGKWRQLYAASAPDAVVLSALAQALAPRIQGHLSPRVFSYQRGRSPWDAVAELADYVRAHRAQRPDPRSRGLYVLRRDARAYGERVPVHAGSPLWPLLREALEGPDETWFAWLQSALRPDVVQPDGRLVKLERGVPTGSPLQPLVNNLYLTPLDRRMEAIEGGFYARFGDDVIFAHPDAEAAHVAARTLDHGIRELDLQWGEDKSQALYFTAVGRAAPAPGFAGVRDVEYLGASLRFDGTVGLKRRHHRELLQRLRRRLDHAMAVLGEAPLTRRAALACGVVNDALNPRHPLCDVRAEALMRNVDDRQQLRQLDRQIALDIAQRVTGRRGVRAFRGLPPRRLRQQWQLVSLEARKRRAAWPG